MIRQVLKTMTTIEFETIKSLELAYSMKFTELEIYYILLEMRKK